MDLNLLQRDVAELVGVTERTVHNWETEAHLVRPAHWPAILEFLGYDPRPPGRTIGEKLKLHREGQGLTAADLARRWGVDPATVTKYELRADRRHNHLSIPRIAEFLGYNPLPAPESAGQYVRHVRYLAGLKQTEFAARLKVSNKAMSEWELDQTSPTPEQLNRIEAISMRLEKPLQIPCPESARATCASSVRPDRRTEPRSTYPAELKTLGDHIRKRRLELNLSQASLAKKLGVNRNAICNWERALQEPSPAIMSKIVEFLGYQPSIENGTLASRLRAKRRALGMKQAEIAALIGAAIKSLHYWETGVRVPKGRHLKRIQEILDS